MLLRMWLLFIVACIKIDERLFICLTMESLYFNVNWLIYLIVILILNNSVYNYIGIILYILFHLIFKL